MHYDRHISFANHILLGKGRIASFRPVTHINVSRYPRLCVDKGGVKVQGEGDKFQSQYSTRRCLWRWKKKSLLELF